MLICTNKPAVDAIFASRAPRPIEDVMRELYPDATRDCNGRFHAPYDGYECPVSGIRYRAGEYLPAEELDDNDRVFSGNTRKFPKAITPEGEQVAWDGTSGQNLAVWAELIAQTKAYDASRSTHLGQVGEMIDLPGLTLEVVKAWESLYGLTFLHILKDAAGNVIIYKGQRLRTGRNPYLDRDIAIGGQLSLRAKIKAHNDRDGVAQTVIQRPKLV